MLHIHGMLIIRERAMSDEIVKWACLTIRCISINYYWHSSGHVPINVRIVIDVKAAIHPQRCISATVKKRRRVIS
jgi:hypothetical protein